MLNVSLARKVPARPGLTIRLVASAPFIGTSHDKRQLARLGFTGAVGQAVLLPHEDRDAELLVGVGPAADLDATVLRKAAAAAAKAAGTNKSAALHHVDVTGGRIDPSLATQVIAEGLIAGGYRFDEHRSKTPDHLNRVAIIGGGDPTEKEGLARGVTIGGAMCLARDLVNEPGGTLTPVEAAARIGAAATEVGLGVTVLDRKGIEAERLGGLLAVNQGSTEEPRFVRLEHRPEGAVGDVAIVGKGITFDSGGLSIKPSEAMMTMKNDMGGAAAVAAAVIAAAELGVAVNVTAYLPFTDNMTGGAAQRPGDVYVARDGTTIEVLNTDAEGRLILADALVMASEEEPDAIIDVATLTGACLVALGDKIAGLMGTSDELVVELQSAAEATGERVWHLPLPEDYRAQLDSTIADIKNLGSRFGGTLTAGLFLKDFVADGIDWAHIDIAGPAFTEAPHVEGPAGGTGFGVRMLVAFLEARAALAAMETDDAGADSGE